MKIVGYVAAILLVICSSCSNIDPQTEEYLLSLAEEGKLFQLREAYEVSKDQVSKKNALFIEAVLLNTFNQNRASIQKIDQLIAGYGDQLADSVLADLYQLKAINHLMLFEYGDAYEANSFLLDSIGSSLDSAVAADAVVMQNIYGPLKKTAVQEVDVLEDSRIPIYRDIANLMNVDVHIGDSIYRMIFDTGAGMSVMKRSFAEQLGLEILETSIDANAATGKVVKSSLAVSEKMTLGNIAIRNAVFLVMDDSDLEFPQVGYFPLGAIGFPVIEEFGEITLTGDDTLIIRKEPGTENLANLRFNGLQPQVYLFNGMDTLPYAFDTGAKKSHLTSAYYEKYPALFETMNAPDTITSYSAGGAQTHLVHTLDSVLLYIGKELASLAGIHCYTESVQTFVGVYGNLGQDLIARFDRLTINFREMYLKFD